MTTIKLYCCENSASEFLGSERFRRTHPAIHVETLRCGGRLQYLTIQDAWEPDTRVMAFFLCPEGNCRFLHGNTRAADELLRLERDWAAVGETRRKLVVLRLASCRTGELERLVGEIERAAGDFLTARAGEAGRG